MQPLRRLVLASLAVAPAVLGLGCGEDLGYLLPVHPAAGKVVRKGEPVKNALVRFHPVKPETLQPPPGQEGPRPSLSTDTDPAGAFVMSSYYEADGVPAGDYIVTVVPLGEEADAAPDLDPTRPTGESENVTDDLSPAQIRAARAKAKSKPRLPLLYADPASSPLKATVAPGAANVFTFELDQDDARNARATASTSTASPRGRG